MQKSSRLVTALWLSIAALSSTACFSDVKSEEQTLSGATPASRNVGLPVLRLLRTAILVSDLERSRAYYEALGFKAETGFDSPRNPMTNPFPLASPSTRSRLLILSDGAVSGARIGLVEFSGPMPPENRVNRARVALGNPVFVLDVSDADALHAALLVRGIEVIEPPQVYVSKQVADDGTAMKGKVFHAWDPDGYLIEFLQAPSKAK